LTLSTSPFAPKTHWYQIRFLFEKPLAVNIGQKLAGKAVLKVNDQRSYHIKLTLALEGTPITIEQEYHLHEQQYWYPNTLDLNTPSPLEAFGLYQDLD